LTDKEELTAKTDPFNPDTDGDGLNDLEEVFIYLTNPLAVDTDGDGLKDGEEVNKYLTDPTKVDTDGDGFSDRIEVLAGKNPVDPKSNPGANLNIYHAVELEFFPLAGFRYQLQVSSDLAAWTNIGAVIEGNGEPFTTFQPARSGARLFYRIELTP
jgi:hypothetical protein